MPDPLPHDGGAHLLEDANSSPRGLRPARALLGWLPDERAHKMFSLGRGDGRPSPAELSALESTRAGVAARPAGIDQQGVVSPLPDELAGHEAALRNKFGYLFDQGWKLSMVDLSRLCALQPAVFTDHVSERVERASRGDLSSLAAVTVSTEEDERPPVSFSRTPNAWVMVSRSPNLHVIDQFSGGIGGAPPGSQGVGFIVGLLPSHFQVAELEGRYFLRDGYHRSIGLLERGIERVPAFVRSMADLGEMSSDGMLDPATYLGERPPLLPDYLSDEVAVSVHLPASQHVVVVQGMELTAVDQL